MNSVVFSSGLSRFCMFFSKIIIRLFIECFMLVILGEMLFLEKVNNILVNL